MRKISAVQYILSGITAILMLSGCAYPISRQLRDTATDIKLPAVIENPAAHKGAVVIWGGQIIKTANTAAGSDIYVLGMPLNYQERPVDEQVSDGRFIARTNQYLDPALYTAGKYITVAGTLEGIEKYPVGEIKYPYPVVRIRELHLWKPEVTYIYPKWYGWGPYDYGWDPYWYGPPYSFPPYYYYEPRFSFGPERHHERHDAEHHEIHEGGERVEHGGEHGSRK